MKNENIPFNEEKITCEEHGQIYKLPILKGSFEQAMELVPLYQELIDKKIDYLYALTILVPSPD